METTAAQLAERYGCGVYVIIVDDYTDYTNGSTRDFAKETYINYDLGVGEDKNGILLVLSISDRDYYLLTKGDIANAAFTDYGQEQLTQEFLDDFRYDNWFAGFRDYMSTAGQYLEESDGANILMIVGIPCLISLAVCGIFAAQMKTARRQTGARGYISHGGVDMRVTQDQFLYHTETRQHIPDKSDAPSGGTTVDSQGFSGRGGKF